MLVLWQSEQRWITNSQTDQGEKMNEILSSKPQIDRGGRAELSRPPSASQPTPTLCQIVEEYRDIQCRLLDVSARIGSSLGAPMPDSMNCKRDTPPGIPGALIEGLYALTSIAEHLERTACALGV
jgi:hypothetical protein